MSVVLINGQEKSVHIVNMSASNFADHVNSGLFEMYL